jgi:tetratricopeptide (TPR) repeat protein
MERHYEELWRRSRPGARPDPFAYIREKAGGAGQSGERLAILRSDLSLRWEAGERIAASWYFERDPHLDEATRVALIYEEYCLGEEYGARPNRLEFLNRYAEFGEQLERLFQIHGFIDSISATAWHRPGELGVELPEAGQTIGGFYLIEELGRGGFARVFLAEERQLANRKIALKVSRRSSREPETLARLQHTHIVPIHFHRTDQATGLHLLCMPYFGRLTLGRLLEHLVVPKTRTGQDLLRAIDELEPGRVDKGQGMAPASRRELASRSYEQAIAWWGARLAEALQHAHEHGFYHRDVKPSNVLITSAGIPMLLDFNLAAVPLWEDEEAQAGLGGTLGYMAPEHVEALAGIHPERVGAAADIYALGLVLYETMGERAFDHPRISDNPVETLLRVARERRSSPPRLRDAVPEVSPAFEAVVRKCLEPEPGDRYATAGELAEDLQAVADDRPLRYAHEPIGSLAPRWIRGKRRALIVAAAVVIAAGSLMLKSLAERVEYERNAADARKLIQVGIDEEETHPEMALGRYQAAATIAKRYATLDPIRLESDRRILDVGITIQARKDAQRIVQEGDSVRSAMLDQQIAPEEVQKKLNHLFAPFHIRKKVDWYEVPELQLLGEYREEVVRTILDLLFLESWYYLGEGWGRPGHHLRGQAAETLRNVLAWQVTERTQRSLGLKDKADDRWEETGLVLDSGPWRALEAIANGEKPRRDLEPQPGVVSDPQTCFYWALIHMLPEVEDAGRQRAWLERAIRLDPSQYWPQYYLGRLIDEQDDDSAREHLFVATVLRPDSPWANLSLANFYRKQLIWKHALWYVDKAIEAARKQGIAFDEGYLNKAVILQRLGRHGEAERLMRELIGRTSERSTAGRRARLNLGSVLSEQGDLRGAFEAYDRAARRFPEDPEAILGRAMMALQMGRIEVAERDLKTLLELSPRDAEVHALLAECAFRRQDIKEAVVHAREAYGLQVITRHIRLREQIECAAGEAWMSDLWDPEEMDHWPLRDPNHRSHVLKAVQRLLRDGDPTVEHAIQAAILLAGIRDERALQVMNPLVERFPSETGLRLARARVWRRFGKLSEALTDVERALEETPADPQLILMQGRLFLEMGKPVAALQRFLQVPNQEQTQWSWGDQARGWMKQGEIPNALDCWNHALGIDSEDVSALVGRAAAFDRSGTHEQAAADLEKALGLAGSNSTELRAVAIQYVQSAIHQPGLIPRAWLAVRRWIASWDAAPGIRKR